MLEIFEILLLIIDKLSGPVLTALIVAPSIRFLSKRQKRKEYSKDLSLFGGKRVIVMKQTKELGFARISVQEAKLLQSVLNLKADCLDFSETEARRLLQSIVSSFGERTDKVIERLTYESGNFYIHL